MLHFGARRRGWIDVISSCLHACPNLPLYLPSNSSCSIAGVVDVSPPWRKPHDRIPRGSGGSCAFLSSFPFSCRPNRQGGISLSLSFVCYYQALENLATARGDGLLGGVSRTHLADFCSCTFLPTMLTMRIDYSPKALASLVWMRKGGRDAGDLEAYQSEKLVQRPTFLDCPPCRG